MSVPRRFTTEDGLLDTSVLQRVMMILFDDGEMGGGIEKEKPISFSFRVAVQR